MNTLEVYLQNKRALFLCQLSVAECTQPYTIWGTYSVWPYMGFFCQLPCIIPQNGSSLQSRCDISLRYCQSVRVTQKLLPRGQVQSLICVSAALCDCRFYHASCGEHVMITTVLTYNMATTLVLSIAYFPTLACCSCAHLKAVLQWMLRSTC